MPGFFSVGIANKLTKWSEHYVDWSRVGELIASGRHKYTWSQLTQRGLIVGASALGAYAGYNYEKEDGELGGGLYSMAGCFVGFVVSHIFVIVPLIAKRREVSAKCTSYEKECLDLLQMLKAIDGEDPKINQLIQKISEAISLTLTINLSDEQHARASQTWGKRLAVMEKIVSKLHEDVQSISDSVQRDSLLDKTTQFWSKDISELSKDLQFYSSYHDVDIEDASHDQLMKRF